MIVVLLLVVGYRVLTAIVGVAVGGCCLLLFAGCQLSNAAVNCRASLSVVAVGSWFSGVGCLLLAVDCR